MKRTFKLENLGCANCAAKMENAITKLGGVHSATISFMTQRLTIDANDEAFDTVLQGAVAACKKIEPDCIIVR